MALTRLERAGLSGQAPQSRQQYVGSNVSEWLVGARGLRQVDPSAWEPIEDKGV